MMEQLQLDLNLVKKEPQYYEDYGQSAGNILDNIIPEPEFDQFGHGASSVPNSEDMDQGVDWLSSFFDEPAHETCNVNGLNPPISKLSDISLNATPTYPSVVKVLGSNSHSGLFSDTLDLISDQYTDDMVYKSPNSVRPPSPDPFLAPSQDGSNTTYIDKQTNELGIISAIRKAQNFRILSQIDRQTLNLTTAKELIQRLKDSQQNSTDTLREQRLGHILNQNVTNRSGNDLINMIVKTESENNDSDSGYESPSQLSPGRVISSPSGCLQEPDCSSSSTENTPIYDQPKERIPFYLSEEEKRTLITEGLPIPTATPLSKAEERALKKVRRKIKNKISAQESRRKKKEYMEALEKKIEIVNGNNSELRKKVDTLENTNKSLTMQLHKLQASVAVKGGKYNATKTTQTSQSATLW